MSLPLDRKRTRRQSRTRLENLEPRTLLSGFAIEVTSSADSGSGSLRQAITEADATPDQPVSIVFDLPTTDPGYNPATAAWTISVDSTLPTLVGSAVTIDSSLGAVIVPGGILIQGLSGTSDSFDYIGDGQDSVVDAADPATTGNGLLTDGGLSFGYSGIGSLAVSGLSSLTLETPNPGNVLSITSPGSGLNEVSGTSGGVAIAPITISSINTVTVNTSVNDSSSEPDTLGIDESGLVAAGLENFTYETGATDASLTVLASSLSLPVAGGSFVFQGSVGEYNTIVAQADVNYTLGSNSLTIPGSGTISLENVQDAQLTGGADSTAFNVIGWAGDLDLDGGPGSNQLIFDDPATYAGNLNLSDFNSTSILIGGDFDGTIAAPQTTTIQQIVISGDDDEGSSILAGAFVPFAGSTAPAVLISGQFWGSITASENLTIAGSGVLTSMEIDGTQMASTGTISAGSIDTLTIAGDLEGSVTAAGAGTIGSVVVGGNLTGTVSAPEDPNPGSGTIGSISVGGSLTGTVSSGTISKITIGKALIGVILASGAGVIGSVVVDGNMSGEVIAELDPNSATSAELGTITVDGTLTGTISAVRQVGQGNLSSIGATGSVEAGNVTTSLSFGSVAGTVNLGTASCVTYLSLASTGVIDATSIGTLSFTQGLAGLLDVSGNLGTITIGQNLTGEVEVGGSLGSLIADGSTSGSIVAGQIGTISALAATGPLILQVDQGGVERQVQATTAVYPFYFPGQAATGSLLHTTFRYFYESGSLANPQLTIQVNNQSGSTAADQFDLSLVTDNAAAKFNLARLDSWKISGIGNVDVEGDILTSVSSQARAFFPGDNNPAGIQLPQDKLESVGVRDFIPYGGYINAASLQAISVGLVGLSWGATVPGAVASAYEVQSLLSSSTRLTEASGTFRVPFTGSSTYQVGFFLDDDTWGQFDWANVAFTIENEVSYCPAIKGNVVTPSNVTRGSDVALIQAGLNTINGASQIEGITISGSGASFATFLPIDGPIVSTGSLGDLELLGSSPVQNITASSIFGTITSFEPYVGTIQTTGLTSDPITGLVSATNGDFGRLYLNGSNQLTTTTFETYSGTFAGQLIVRGNLVSNVIINSNATGAIAIQGNIGTMMPGGRLGGITIDGGESGTVVALGQIVGNLAIYGNLGSSGAIVASDGIVGNLTITGNMAAGSKIVSGASIGSSSLGTSLTIYGNIGGIIAAEGSLVEWAWDPVTPDTFANQSTLKNGSGAVIDEVLGGYSGSVVPLTLLDSTTTSLDLSGYDDIMAMLADLHVNKAGKLSVSTPS